MAKKLTYPGRDLEAMNFAQAYHRWILSLFKPYLGERIVEVGAGSGGFSEMLLENRPKVFAGVEPAAEMYPLLKERVSGTKGTEVVTYQDFFSDVATEIKTRARPDTFVYVNVLEHIEHDQDELKLVYDTLSGGGHALIFVPALPALFGPLDAKIGHFRRYTKRELERKAATAGFDIITCHYFDLAGVLPWWVKFRLLRSSDIEPGAVKLYDGLVVPIMRPLERLIKPPIGKNLLMVAKKK